MQQRSDIKKTMCEYEAANVNSLQHFARIYWFTCSILRVTLVLQCEI